MRVYEVGGVSDAELIKSKTKTRARVEPPLTAAEQRHVAERLSAAHAGMALWRACKRKACRRRRRCGGDVDQCGARRSPRAWACVHEILAAIRAGKTPRVRRRAWPAEGRCRSACGTFSVSAFRLSGSRRSTPTAPGAFSARGSHRPS